MPVDLRGQHLLVAGFARQGQALARWLPRQGALTTISDSKTAAELGLNEADLAAQYPGVVFALGSQSPDLLAGIDALCVSGGVPLDLPLVQAALARGIPLTNDAQLLLERCPALTLGITGSAGKTTTTTLVGEMLRAAGRNTWVGGNIGAVLLDDLDQIAPSDSVVVELSSFQLELMTISPDIAAVLNITPNHLDRHGTMEAYTRAKAHILDFQDENGIAVLSRDDAGSHDLAPRTHGLVCWFSLDQMVPEGAFLAGNRLVVTGRSSTTDAPQVVAERGDLLLRGDHNVRNALAACALAGAAGVPPAAMAQTLRSFRGVAHRLENVAIRGGVTYINDSIATAPERVLAALRSFTEPLVLLLGGRDKQLPWDEMLAQARHQCRCIIAFGEAAEIVEAGLRRLHAEDLLVRAETLAEAVAAARACAQPGDVVLLSPGGTSYDAYHDFAERGEHFRRLVLESADAPA